MTEIITSILPYAAALVAAIGALLWARQSGKQSARNDQQAIERAAIEKAREVENENNSKDIGAIRSDAGRWVRNDKR